ARLSTKVATAGAVAAVTADVGSASFQQVDLNTSGQVASSLVTQLGSCLVTQIRSPALTPAPVAPLPVGLNAGAAINVSGPNGKKQMTSNATGVYSATFANST